MHRAYANYVIDLSPYRWNVWFKMCSVLSLWVWFPVNNRTLTVSLFYRVIGLLLGLAPKGATSFPDRGSYQYDQIRVSMWLFGLLCLVVQVYWVVLSCVFVYVVWFCLLVR